MRSILVVDDYGPFRLVVREMLERDGFRVVGEASDGSGAVDGVLALRPDVVLLDVHLPGDDGFMVCERLQALSPAPQVVLTSSHDASDLGPMVEGSNFIPKSELSGEALRRILDDQP